jgi:16S rRNA (guanine527-N7)-methyltransferase
MVTARACAPLERLLSYAERYFSLGARGLFLKGATAGEEVDRARKRWHFDCETFASLSDPRGKVLLVSALRRNRRSASSSTRIAPAKRGCASS